jgi:hypothetical protein
VKNSSVKVSAKEVHSGVPTEKLDGGWPAGWTKKIFERMSGKTAGSTDSYWYSPVTKIKMRSIIEVKRFLAALARCGGDETLAWKLVKATSEKNSKENNQQTKKEKETMN